MRHDQFYDGLRFVHPNLGSSLRTAVYFTSIFLKSSERKYENKLIVYIIKYR
jgi:hypothetical protein